MHAEGMSGMNVSRCAITSVGGVCVSYGTSASGVVEKSELTGASGVEVRGGSQVKVLGNTIVVGQAGISYHDQSSGAISGNRINGAKESGCCGISVEGTVEVEISDNEIAGRNRG